MHFIKDINTIHIRCRRLQNGEVDCSIFYHPHSEGCIVFSTRICMFFVCLSVCSFNTITAEPLEVSSRNFQAIWWWALVVLLLQAVCTKPICCGFAAVLKLNFGFPNLGERESLWGWAFVVSDGVSVTCYISHDYKAIRCLLWFCRRV